VFELRPPLCGQENRTAFQSGFSAQHYVTHEAERGQYSSSILGDPNLGLTATSRVILLHLAQHPSGARIEEIAFSTGSKYRWVESQVSRLTQLNILRRVTPGMYAINTDREVGQ
jgi:hypothetical protein